MQSTHMLAALSALALCGAAHAQINLPYPPFHFVEVNAITNPGFETGTQYWDRTGAYYVSPDGDLTYNPNIDQWSLNHHTGSRGMNLKFSNTPFGAYTFADLKQALVTPLATNAVWNARFWARSSGQTVFMTVTYTDGTGSHGQYYVNSYDAQPGDNGWVKINYYNMLKAGKTIKQIDFYADSITGSDVTIDDVSLVYFKIIQ